MVHECAQRRLVACLAYTVNVVSKRCQFLGNVDTTYQLERLFDTAA
jgi:hypothetical protein